MKTYIVLYRPAEDQFPGNAPEGFKCQADDTEHAEEQCEDAYPGCRVVWVVITGFYQAALGDYYGACNT